MIKIAFLADYPETIPKLTQWFQTQWPAYYANRTLTNIAEDFYAEASRTKIPIRLVACVDGKLAGTISLREQALQTLPEYQPGLGGLWVAEGYRGRGIGTELVRAGMNAAWELGFDRVYTATTTASGILTRLGWKLIQTVFHDDEQLMLYRYELENHASITHKP
jgi:RimJ/RimL family protein N-acetyltransferase